MTGASYESLAEFFTPYGQIEEIILVPEKSFCFVQFSTVKNAQQAFDECNGQKSLRENSVPIYLSYISSIPEQYKKGIKSCSRKKMI